MNINAGISAFVYLIGIGLLLIFNEINYRRLHVKGEISRKFAHFASALAVIPLPYIFASHWYVLMLATVFFLVLFITQKRMQLQSIHNIERRSIGSYLLPLSIYITFLIQELCGNKLYYILPMLILAVCDPLAALVGISLEKYNHKIKIFGIQTQKSLFGSLAFFITCLVISLIALSYKKGVFDATTVFLSFLIAIAGTLGELFSWRGSDNLSIPLSIILVLKIFL